VPSNVPATGSDKLARAEGMTCTLSLARLSGMAGLIRWHMVCERLVLVLTLAENKNRGYADAHCPEATR
jgi:hypothetical protein